MIIWDHLALAAARAAHYTHDEMRAAASMGSEAIYKIESAPSEENQPTRASLVRFCTTLGLDPADYILGPGTPVLELDVPDKIDLRTRLHPIRDNDTWKHARTFVSMMPARIRARKLIGKPVTLRALWLTFAPIPLPGKADGLFVEGHRFDGKWRVSLDPANGRRSDGINNPEADPRTDDEVWMGLLDRKDGPATIVGITLAPGELFESQVMFDAGEQQAPVWSQLVEHFSTHSPDLLANLHVDYDVEGRKGSQILHFSVPGAQVHALINEAKTTLAKLFEEYQTGLKAGGPKNPRIEKRLHQFSAPHPAMLQPFVSGGKYDR